MASISLRSIKGFPLTIEEVDSNFSNLNIEVGQKLNSSDYTANDILNKLKTVDADNSGLNASTLRSLLPASTNSNNTIVSRDGSGNFAANVITASLIGNVNGTVTGALIGNSSNVNGIVAIPNGGTGGASKAQALTNLLPADGLSGYVLKTSGPGSYFWAAETGSSFQSGTKIQTTRNFFTAIAGQTFFSGIGTYIPGSNQLRVYIDGVRQFNSAYSETSSTSFTLVEGVAAGTLVMAEVDGYIEYDFSADEISFSPVGSVSALNVQNAIAELDVEKASISQNMFIGTTSVAINRTSSAISLTGVSIDGTAGNANNLGGVPAANYALTANLPAAYAGINTQIFTQSGTFNVPAGITRARVTVVAGGGGGSNGPGGAGGMAVAMVYGITGSIAITVGTGGAGVFGGGTTAGAGGGSAFGSFITATGGAGGATYGGANGTGTVSSGTPIRTNSNSGQAEQYGIPYIGGSGKSTGGPATWSATSTIRPGAGGSGINIGGMGGVIIVEY